MDVAQMMAHVSNVLEIAVADKKPPRSLLGRVLGGFVKKSWLDDSPIPHNSPTDSSINTVSLKSLKVLASSNHQGLRETVCFLCTLCSLIR